MGVGKTPTYFDNGIDGSYGTNGKDHNMKKVVYKRHGTPTAVMGNFYYLGKRVISILELPWKYNEEKVSCIPTGTYLCRLQEHVSKSGNQYPAYEVTGAPDRTDIEIHIGNTVVDSLGCLIEGTILDETKERVLESAVAHKLFLDTMEQDPEFQLEIIDEDGVKRNLDPVDSVIHSRIPDDVAPEPATVPPAPWIDMNEVNKVNAFQKTWVWLDGKKRVIGLGLMGIGWLLKKVTDPAVYLIGEGLEVAGSALAAVGVVSAEVKKVQSVEFDTLWEKIGRFVKTYLWPFVQEWLTKKK